MYHLSSGLCFALFALTLVSGEPQVASHRPCENDALGVEIVAKYYASCLASMQQFEPTVIGFSGTYSRSHACFQGVLRSKHASVLFSEMVKNGSKAGQIYGLCGLYLVDKGAFYLLMPKYQKELSRVPVRTGCVETVSTIAEIVKSPLGSPDIAGGRLPALLSGSSRVDLIVP